MHPHLSLPKGLAVILVLVFLDLLYGLFAMGMEWGEVSTGEKFRSILHIILFFGLLARSRIAYKITVIFWVLGAFLIAINWRLWGHEIIYSPIGTSPEESIRFLLGVPLLIITFGVVIYLRTEKIRALYGDQFKAFGSKSTTVLEL